jgi:hypothetical protein
MLAQGQHAWIWPFWVVVVLSVPSFSAATILIGALIRPNVWLFAEAPLLYFYIPASLILAVLIAAATHRFMRRGTRRRMWYLLASSACASFGTFAVLSVLGTR